ncbi:DUF4870 domain-containing protein [Pseudomarimonas arenosa]
MTDAQNPSPTPPPPGDPAGPGQEARQWAMFTHLSALVGFLIPLGSIIAPLIMWQVKKAESPFIDEQGKEALNFQITVLIAVIVCIILSFVLIGLLLLPIVGIGALVLTIIAGIKANEGVSYRYPMTLRLIS